MFVGRWGKERPTQCVAGYAAVDVEEGGSLGAGEELAIQQEGGGGGTYANTNASLSQPVRFTR